jgi:PAS domain S-box-containing protein
MTKDEADSQIAALRQEVGKLRELLRQHGISAAENAISSVRRDHHHDRETAMERARTAGADLRAKAQSERADRAETSRLELESRHEKLVRDAEFNRQVLKTTTDCIKVLDLDGRLEFMNAGGMRVMEIDDFATVNMCPWVEFWQGNERDKAAEAVAMAKEGSAAQFEGQAATAKGNVRWWEVVVSPIIGEDGRPVRLLSISRDVTARHLLEKQRRLLFEEMHHRIKNTIAAVQGIAQQTLRHASDLGTASRALGQRLVGLGKAHDLLIRNEWLSADMHQIVTEVRRIKRRDNHG